MSVFRTKKSAPYFWFGFQINRHRFYGSTKCKDRKQPKNSKR